MVWLLTLGRLTLGMMTVLRAEGASRGAWEVSPPGWYWYLPWLPEFQGSEPGTLATGFSEVAEVGLRAGFERRSLAGVRRGDFDSS